MFLLKDDDFYKTPKWKINPAKCQRIKKEIRKCVKLNAMEKMTYETMAGSASRNSDVEKKKDPPHRVKDTILLLLLKQLPN